MKSNLEKSIYLGLAALTFASITGISSIGVNAKSNGHKNKTVNKQAITYKTSKKDLSQSLVFKSTGKNAVYTKPNGVKGAKLVISKTAMKAKKDSNDVKNQFMVYQEAVTNKGYHYYKVVSFDKKVRGYVFNKGVVKTNVKSSADMPSQKTGKLSSDRLFNVAYGSRFGAKLKHFDNVANREFNVTGAVKINNNAIYYNVIDNKDSAVNGWINAGYFIAKKDTPKPQTTPSNNISYSQITQKDIDMTNIKDILKNQKDGKINLSNAEKQFNVNSLNDLANKIYSTGVNNTDSAVLLNQIHSEIGNEASQKANTDKLKNVVAKKTEGGKIDLNNAASQLGIASGNLSELANKVYNTGVSNDDSNALLNQIHSEMGNEASQKANTDKLKNIIDKKTEGGKIDLNNAASQLGVASGNLSELANKVYATGVSNDDSNALLNQIHSEMGNNVSRESNKDILQNIVNTKNDEKFDLDKAKSKLDASNLSDLLNKIYATGLTNDQVNGLDDLELQINEAIGQDKGNQNNINLLSNIIGHKKDNKIDLNYAQNQLGASSLSDLLNKIYETGLKDSQINGLNDLEQQINVAIYQQENKIIPLKSYFLQHVFELVNDNKISNVYLKKETNQNIEGNIGLHFTYNGSPKFENLTSDMLTSGGNWAKSVSYNDPLNESISPSEEDSIRNTVWNNNDLNIININKNVITAENGYKVTFE